MKQIGALVFCLLMLSSVNVMAQPIDYCEGNFDNDFDQDGSDAFVFKTDFGRSSLSNPCPVIECQTAEELEIRIVQLETQLAQVTALLENVTRGIVQGHDTIQFSGVNVQIVDGSGTTGHDVNGLGNLIVGYNETRNDGTDNRTGSHNLVVGQRHSYSSYGGLVTGYQNNVLGIYATVSGGQNNTASGDHASVSGGAQNTASGQHTNVAGGRYNEASGNFSFVGGGGFTTEADGNKAFGHYSAVLGGRNNLTGDPDLIDHTFAQSATVSGGQHNIASGSRSSVSGGFYNTATAWGASVCGGYENEATGDYASVSGGRTNTASSQTASVSGGWLNTASGQHASVSGGWTNTASGDIASVSGGRLNTASGNLSSVSGGDILSAAGEYDWRAGSCYFCEY